MTARFTIEGRTGYVTLDNPPVNAIGQPMRAALLEAVRAAEAQFLDRVIVTGAGRAFAAGADAKEFDADPVAPHLPDVLDAIERSFVPWVAAINGVALGGGAEIAMACRMRIMAPMAQIGLPEVTLGVIPGAGGTQRLPRLVGLTSALDMIAFGKPISAARAFEIGLVDAVEDDPADAAFMVNTEALGDRVPVWELPPPDLDTKAISAARARVTAKLSGQIAPQQAIDVIEAGLDQPFEAATAAERATFLALKTGPQARAMRHLFFAERAAPKAAPDVAAHQIDAVGVIGGGTMGAGIAYALLNAGLPVTLIETDQDGVARARVNVERIIEASLKRGLIDVETAGPQGGHLTVLADYEAVADLPLVIEAAFEDMTVKRDIFQRLEAVCRRDAILATNTSYLDLDAIAATVADPARVLGLHFFAPAHIMKLLEIVRGANTSETALATGFALAKRLRKVPVLAGVCDGFIGNRILARYREAADTILMDGATPWEIDEAMVGFGYAMGPYEAQDLSGLDIAHANRRRQDATRDPNRRYIPIADRMVDLGKLGRKTGAGWYRYPGGGGKVEDPIVADLAIEEARFAGVERRDFEPDEIRETLLAAMVNEACDILDEGVAGSAADIDLVTVLGYGFPRWRGGLMHYAESLGFDVVLGQIEAQAKNDPVAWRPSARLRKLAQG